MLLLGDCEIECASKAVQQGICNALIRRAYRHLGMAATRKMLSDQMLNRLVYGEMDIDHKTREALIKRLLCSHRLNLMQERIAILRSISLLS